MSRQRKWQVSVITFTIIGLLVGSLMVVGQRTPEGDPTEQIGASSSIRSKRHHRVLGYLNGQRTTRGRDKLRFANRGQSRCAQRWAVRMSETRLKHSPRGSCNHEGENVGKGPSLHSVFRAFWRSDSHRRNNLRRRWRRVGVGVVRVNGTWFVVLQFHD